MYNKKKMILSIIIISLLIIIGGLCFIFYREFNRANNPIMAGIGLIKITILNRDYIIIQENPKKIISKSNNALNILKEYMGLQGFQIIDQMGSFVIFENDLSEQQSF